MIDQPKQPASRPVELGSAPTALPGGNSGLLVFVLLGTLIAVAFALTSAPRLADFPLAFALSLAFIQWVLIASLGLLVVWNRLRPATHTRWNSLRAVLVFPAVCAAFSLLVLVWLPFAVRVEDAGWFVLRNTLLAAVLSLVFSRYLSLQASWRAQIAAESKTRLNALQAWIRPHFLFNALNTIVSLIPERPDRAEQAALDLSHILRTGLAQARSHTLSDELDLVRSYLRIEALRLEDRLQVSWRLDEDLPLNLPVPPLLLQPLVENAIVHGISRRAAGGEVVIEGRRIRFGRLRFIVRNPLGDAGSRPAAGNQSALENIRQRLALAYEERYGLKTWVEGGGFKAELTLPLE